ncbi:hypothetical protein EC957_006091 [Mortierella hygrophila]|uniref:Uncharacterized protein n=1 Tax=Mortierella hygrophila TaxID=979708 RepID=A0A9P6FEP5_9FUNG|nr:hypothetical protein EC957_006091 [Mortierella hygrophila]
MACAFGDVSCAVQSGLVSSRQAVVSLVLSITQLSLPHGIIVPVPEIDSSMECTVLNPGECLVKYFEDNKYSVVPFSDLQHFKPTTIPFLEFELAAGQKFLKNGGVVNALSYLDSGKVKRRFSWNRWGSAQDQDLNLDMQRSKAINLPLITDEEYLGSQPQSQAVVASHLSSAASSPAVSTKDDTDIEFGSNDPLHIQGQSGSGLVSGSSSSMPLTPSSSASSSLINSTTISAITATATQAAGNTLKNGMQRPVAGGISSQQQQTATTLLPSPVSLQDLATAEPMDEIEFGTRSTKTKTEGTATKDSPVSGRSRSRRGSREVDPKTSSSSPVTSLSAATSTSSPKDTASKAAAAAAADKKENSKRSRNASEQSSSPGSSTSGSNSNNNIAGTTPSTEAGLTPTSGSGEGIKRRKTGGEPTISTDSQSVALESGAAVLARSSRQGSVESNTSPRSTRHSSRHSKASENIQQAGQGEPRSESPVEPTVSARLPTHRMTRQRSMPKSANSLPPPAPPITVQTASSEAEQTSNTLDVKEGKALHTEETAKNEETEETKPSTGAATTEEESTAMDVDEAEPKSTRNQGRGREKSGSIPPSSLVSTTASSATSSPSSMGPDDGQMPSSASTTSSTTSTNGRLQSLVLDRQGMDRGFEIVLPTLAIGSKEREAFYENIMDHMQKLRQEHRRLKEVLKSSEYVPKGRRATRSSPQYYASHHHHRHHHHRRHSPAEEKQSYRNESPALSKSSSASTPNPNSGNGNSSGSSNKENQATPSSKASSSTATAVAVTKAEAAAAKAEAAAAAAAAAAASLVYQGSTPSSAILTSNISTTTRRSAATAAAAAVTATVSRASRQSHQSNGSNGSSGDKESKRRGGAAAAAAVAQVQASAPAITSDGGAITTRAKRRLR